MDRPRNAAPTERSSADHRADTAAPRVSSDALRMVDAYWRAANYLSVGQIYLRDNPLLREPLTLAHVKSRLLGHWGTTPGLNFIYAHMNRVIRERDVDAIFIAGPGHGGPGVVANCYLDSTYSEVYPAISRDAEGLKRCSPSSRIRAAFPVMSRRRPPDRSTKGESSGTRCSTHSAPRSTTRSCSSAV